MCVYVINFIIFPIVYRFSVKILESNQDKLSAAVVLDDKLDYNERMIYQILLTASVCTIFMLHLLYTEFMMFSARVRHI